MSGAAGEGRFGIVLRLALPSAGELLLGTLVGVVNTYLVGHLGAAPLAAVGLAFHAAMIGMILFNAVGTGATALIARMVGAGDWKGANRVVWQALILAALTGLVFMVPLELLAAPILKLLAAEGEVLELGVTYLRIYCSVFAFSSVMYIGNACMRGAGDTRTPLLVMAVVNLLNIVVAWLLVNGQFGLPQLGVKGAALGALTGRLVGGLMVVGLLLKGRSGLKLRWCDLHIDPGVMRRIARIGFPVGFEQVIFRLGMLVYVRLVSSLGTVAFAAHQVALNAESISFMPGYGFAVAATTLVGQGLGARDPERAERDAYTAGYLSAGLMSIMGICFILFPEPLIGFFTTDPEVIRQGVEPLRLAGLAQPFLAAMMVFGGGLRGAGDTLTPMCINGSGVWLLRIPLALLFTRIFPWGLLGIWIASSLDMVLRGMLLFFLFRRGRWKTAQV
jgi:multidrug resistance protein, MATE family